MTTPEPTPEGDARPSQLLAPNLTSRYTRRQRIMLTYRYHGGWSLVYRALTLPLRFTPLRSRLTRGSTRPASAAAAARWYRAEGRPVTIVIPSYRDFAQLAALVESVRVTTRRDRVRIVVCDDASGSDHVASLRAIDGIDVVAGEINAGFAANVNRGLAATDPEDDVVLLNSDTIARRGWLERLQYAAGGDEKVGIVGGKLLYPDGRIQFAGTVRNLGAPEWFDHRYRFKPSGWGPANVPQPVTAVSGACMYLTRALLDELGGFDPEYPMAYEDVDLCLRAWQAGFKVLYWPDAELTHLESVSRGTEVGERERASQRRFWERWGDFFDAREVRTQTGALRVVYVTEDTGVGGGHRDIFEHLNRLQDRGHAVELWSLGPPPEWFELRVPVRTFGDYDALVEALTPVKAIKVATWWTTASPVWRASVVEGIPVFFVQDIETSYYAGNTALQNIVLSWYRPEFRYMTISSWNRDRLRELGLEAVLIPPGIDLENFRARPEVARRTDMVLAIGRTNPLKNLPLTIAAWRGLPEPRPELCLFGIEPELADEPGIRYVASPSDDEVSRLFNEATVFLQTSTHEGFCLPALESMATGGAVVCTDAHGNRDFCTDGENCLMPEPDQHAVTAALRRLLGDPELRARLGRAGIATASNYVWALRIDELEQFLNEVATPRRITPSTDAVPGGQPSATGSPRRMAPSG
ncbi:MAG TPA: glycosyltransferase [Solirubrobacteraceae bacterium]|nr:glycosyltransferase [Solirubrobacteraceae bacterium]